MAALYVLDCVRSSNFELANDPSPQLASLMRDTCRQTMQHSAR